jgi:DNA polymerase-1
MRRPIVNNTAPGEMVYEPFLGSGTTLIAAEMTGRVCRAIELNPAYVGVSIYRWQMMTGRLAVLDDTGETFAEVLARRSAEPSVTPQTILTHTQPPITRPPVTVAPPALTRPTPPPAAVTLAPRGYAAQPASVQLVPRMPVTDWVLPELPTVRGMGCKVIGFDTEGTGLRPFHGDRAGGFSIKFGMDGPGIYVPFGHKRGVNFDRDTVARWWRSEMETYTGDVVFTFALFDLIFASREGFEFKSARAFHDTCVRETLLDEHVGDNSLNGQALRYLGRGKDETQLNEIAAYYGIKDVKKHMMDIPPEYMGRYATTDPTLSLGVYHAQETALANQDLLSIYEIERKQIPILFGMLKRGVRIDVPRAEALLGKLNTELASWEERFRRMAGNGAEFRSPMTLAPVLRDRGLDVPKTKPSKSHPEGQDSITEDWLLEHKGTDGIIDATLACRRVATIATYVEKSILGQQVNGRIHPWFNQLMRDRDDGGKRGAATGRYSCTDPNMQATAKREKLIDADLEMDEEISKSVRRLFPPEDDEDWQRDDYSQEEFRINVHVAVGDGADDARARYNNEPKLSFHKMAGEMAGLDIEDKKLYDRIKALNLAKSYGAQPKKLAKVLKCSVEDAKAFVDVYERQLPFTVATFKEAMRVASGRGYVRTLLGRRLRFPFWEPPNNHGERWRRPLPHAQAIEAYGPNVVRAGAYRALNWYCQGSAADILKKALVDAHEAGVFDVIGFPLLIVHDEIDTSIPRTREGDEAGRELTRIMESTVKLKVPLLVESSRGATWGDCA